jgi:hypothetical protein
VSEFIAQVRVPMGGSGTTTIVQTRVQAAHFQAARWLLEAQYGKDNVVSLQPA